MDNFQTDYIPFVSSVKPSENHRNNSVENPSDTITDRFPTDTVSDGFPTDTVSDGFPTEFLIII